MNTDMRRCSVEENGWIKDGCMDGWTDREIDGLMDGWIVGGRAKEHGGIDGYMDG